MSIKTERAEQKAHTTQRIHALRKQGLSHKAIAERLSVAKSLVQRRLSAGPPPDTGTPDQTHHEPLTDDGTVLDKYAALSEELYYWKQHALTYRRLATTR